MKRPNHGQKNDILNFKGYFSKYTIEWGFHGPEEGADGKIYLSVFHYLQYIGEDPFRYNTNSIGLNLMGPGIGTIQCKYKEQTFVINKFDFDLLESNINTI
jgi:hypothetical protein